MTILQFFRKFEFSRVLHILILNKGFSPRMGFNSPKVGSLTTFKTGEIWDDLVIKWLLGHCIHQHVDFSKGVLVPSQDRSQDY